MLDLSVVCRAATGCQQSSVNCCSSLQSCTLTVRWSYVHSCRCHCTACNYVQNCPAQQLGKMADDTHSFITLRSRRISEFANPLATTWELLKLIKRQNVTYTTWYLYEQVINILSIVPLKSILKHDYRSYIWWRNVLICSMSTRIWMFCVHSQLNILYHVNTKLQI
jgi:hypothetical protein